MLQINNGTKITAVSQVGRCPQEFLTAERACYHELGMEIQTGDVFIFLNKRQTHLKALEWEGDGFSLYYKRLRKAPLSYLQVLLKALTVVLQLNS